MSDFISAIVQGTGSILEGAARREEFQGAARQSEREARQELIIGEADALELDKELNAALASSIASAGARGVAGTGISGSAEAAAKELIAEASFAQRISTQTAQIAAGSKRIEAARFRQAGESAFTAGLFMAGGSIGQAIERKKTRG